MAGGDTSEANDTSDTLTEGDVDAPRARGRVEPALFLVLECGRMLSSGARWSLAGVDEVVIGRGSVREATRVTDGGVRRLHVRVPDRWMSSVHARLARRAGEWTLEDAGSTNGSLVNGERATSVTLADDDAVELGHTFFFVRDVEVPAGAAAGDLDAASLGPHVVGTQTLLPELASRFDAIARVAPTTVPVLLLGETGTGKEVVARAIHGLSERGGDFVAVNCGALPESLLESQLFGHVKGAFSGAARDALGFVRAAEGGTLFLDEIGDLSLRSQAALLRVLQEREVVPVGATRPVRVDLRVIAATHRPLDTLAARGEFRSDLFARLAGLRVNLPPLRERKVDMGILVADALMLAAPARAEALSLAAAAGRAFVAHEWPLNVRELSQALALSAALAGADGVIDLAHLPQAIASARPSRTGEVPAAPESLSPEDARLRAELVTHLEIARGNVSEVARAMGKARTQIHRWVKRFAIDLDAYRDPRGG